MEIQQEKAELQLQRKHCWGWMESAAEQPSPPWGPCPSLPAQAAPQEATLLGDMAHPGEMWLQGASVLCQPW